MADITMSKEEERRQAVKEAALEKAKKVHDEYEEKIEEMKMRRVLVDRECGAQVKASNEAVVDNNAEIVRINTLLEKAAAKEIKLSFKEKNDMKKELKDRKDNQEKLMYEAFDLQDEYKEVMQQITDEIKALREEQNEKEIRAKYSGQYLKITIENVLHQATKPYSVKDITDYHCDLRKIDVHKIDIVLNQMVHGGEIVATENAIGTKFYEYPKAPVAPAEEAAAPADEESADNE